MHHSKTTKLGVTVPHKFTDGVQKRIDYGLDVPLNIHCLTLSHIMVLIWDNFCKIAFVLVEKKFYRYIVHICMTLSFQMWFQNWLPTSEIFPHENCFMIDPTRVLLALGFPPGLRSSQLHNSKNPLARRWFFGCLWSLFRRVETKWDAFWSIVGKLAQICIGICTLLYLLLLRWSSNRLFSMTLSDTLLQMGGCTCSEDLIFRKYHWDLKPPNQQA